jgi:hypothetical protein
VNGDTILNGLARVISTLFLEEIGGNFHVSASDTSVLGLTATQLRDVLDDSRLAGKANAGHIHAFSLYTGTAGDPPHEHLVQGTTEIEQ